MKISIVRCSDVRREAERHEIDRLCTFLSGNGAIVNVGNYLFEEANGKQRAEELMKSFVSGSDLIFDISGGDSCEQLLPYIDYDLIASSESMLWGYSDLTVILNAVYAKTGKASVLWQARNIVRDKSGIGMALFSDWLSGGNSLFEPSIDILRGDGISGNLVGGNLRCFLKLAGTEYFPDTAGKVIFSEARSGNAETICRYFDILLETGSLGKAAGLVLGTFTEAGRLGEEEEIISYILSKTELPVARTAEIGHAPTSKAMIIGGKFRI